MVKILRIALTLAVLMGLTFGAAGVVVADGDDYDDDEYDDEKEEEKREERKEEKREEKKEKREERKERKEEKREEKKERKEKVTICHKPPGNPSNAHTITVREKAAKKHLANHRYDHKGACEDKHHKHY